MVFRRRLLVQYGSSAVVLGVVLVLPRRVVPVFGVLVWGLPRWWWVPLFIVWVPLFIVWVPLLGGVPLCGRGYPSHSSPLVLDGGVYTLWVDPTRERFKQIVSISRHSFVCSTFGSCTAYCCLLVRWLRRRQPPSCQCQPRTHSHIDSKKQNCE